MKTEDHDILLELKKDIEYIKDRLENHLQHHFRYALFAWSITGSAIIALIVALIKIL